MKKILSLSLLSLIMTLILTTNATASSFLPTSGWEPEFDYDWWYNYVVEPGEGLKYGYPNCYAYALNYKKYPDTSYNFSEDECQPGLFAHDNGDPRSNFMQYSGTLSEKLEAAFFADMEALGRSAKKVNKYSTASDRHYKIVLFIDEDEGEYHFLRQDETGYWSQKPNQYRNIEIFDSNGDYIVDPDTALLTYGRLNYDKRVNYYEIYYK